jgi:hypothetical protein
MNISLIDLLDTDEKLKVRIIILMLTVLSFGIYSGTIGHGYNMDDTLVTQGHRLTSKGFSAIGQILTSPYYEDEMGYSYEYRPITHLSFAIEHGLFGERAEISHLLNVLIHSLTVCIVLLVCRSMYPLGSLLFPLLAALMFAVHPMHTEAVASIKNRDELLALLFSLLTLFYAIRSLNGGSVANWLLIPLFLNLSLLSKASSANFLLMIPMCTLLTPVFDVRKLGLLLSAVSIPIAVFLFLKGFRLNSYITVGLFLTGPFIVIILWQFVKRTGIDRIMDFLRPAGWPSHAFGKQLTLSGLEMSDAPITVVAIVAGLTGFTSNRPVILGVAMCIFLVLPFWLGRYRLALLLLSASMLTLLSSMMSTVVIVYITMIYTTTVFYPMSIQNWKSFSAMTLITLIALVISDFGSYLISWDSSFFSTLCSMFTVIFPIIVTHFFSYTRIFFVRLVWFLGCVGNILGFLIGHSEDEVLFLLGNMFGLVYFTFRWPRWLPAAQHMILVLLVVSIVVVISRNILLVPNPGHERGVNSDMGIASPNLSESEYVTTTALEYRPLAFLEYPLGIEAPLGERIGTASLVLGHYLVKMFIPWPQAFYYGYDEVPLGDWMNPLAVLSLLVHAVLLLLVFYFGRSHPILAFGILAYLSSMFLFSNFVATIPGMIGDRLTYVASFGFCVSLGYVLTLVYQRLFTAVAKGMFAVAVVTLMVVWSGMTKARAAKWKDPLTLMRHDISTVPNSAQAHNILASNLMQASFDPNTEEDLVEMRLEAIHHFRESLRIWPKTMNVWYDLGRAYMIVDDSERALLCFMSAYGLDSTFTYAAWNAAEIAQNLGRDSLAEEYYRHCIRFSPEMEEAYSRLSYIYLIRGEHEKSIAVNRLAIAREPSWRAPYDNMAQVFEAIEMPDSVEAYIRKRNAIGVP